MSTPPRDDEPDEPVDGVAAGHRSPDDDAEPGPSDGAGRTPDDDEAAWLAIVANFGDRADLGDADLGDGPARGARDGAAPDHRLGHPAGTGRVQPPQAPDHRRDPDEPDLARGPEDRFVPPTPPPLPLPRPARLLAWLGVLGVPVAVLVTLLVGASVPSWVGTVLMVWFVGGFAYLVARMRRDHQDPGDGAVV